MDIVYIDISRLLLFTSISCFSTVLVVMDSQQPGPSGLQASRSRVYDTARVIQHLEDSDLDDDFDVNHLSDDSESSSEDDFNDWSFLQEDASGIY